MLAQVRSVLIKTQRPPVRQGQRGPRVHRAVGQAVRRKIQVFHNRRLMHHDMHGRADIYLIAGENLLGADRPTDDGPPLENGGGVPGPLQIVRAYQAVVPATDHGYVYGSRSAHGDADTHPPPLPASSCSAFWASSGVS